MTLNTHSMKSKVGTEPEKGGLFEKKFLDQYVTPLTNNITLYPLIGSYPNLEPNLSSYISERGTLTKVRDFPAGPCVIMSMFDNWIVMYIK